MRSRGYTSYRLVNRGPALTRGLLQYTRNITLFILSQQKLSEYVLACKSAFKHIYMCTFNLRALQTIKIIDGKWSTTALHGHNSMKVQQYKIPVSENTKGLVSMHSIHWDNASCEGRHGFAHALASCYSVYPTSDHTALSPRHTIAVEISSCLKCSNDFTSFSPREHWMHCCQVIFNLLFTWWLTYLRRNSFHVIVNGLLWLQVKLSQIMTWCR